MILSVSLVGVRHRPATTGCSRCLQTPDVGERAGEAGPDAYKLSGCNAFLPYFIGPCQARPKSRKEPFRRDRLLSAPDPQPCRAGQNNRVLPWQVSQGHQSRKRQRVLKGFGHGGKTFMARACDRPTDRRDEINLRPRNFLRPHSCGKDSGK